MLTRYLSTDMANRSSLAPHPRAAAVLAICFGLLGSATAAPECNLPPQTLALYQAALKHIETSAPIEPPMREDQLKSALLAAEKASCRGAALALATVKLHALSEQGLPQADIDRFATEMDGHLQHAVSIGEGHFLAGLFYSSDQTKYFSAVRAERHLQLAAEGGNVKGITFLWHLYRDGAPGFAVDEEKAKFWMEKLPPAERPR